MFIYFPIQTFKKNDVEKERKVYKMTLSLSVLSQSYHIRYCRAIFAQASTKSVVRDDVVFSSRKKTC